MAKKMSGLDKLEKLGRFIRAGEFAEGNSFNMASWYDKHTCGTSACMGGYAAAMWPSELKFSFYAGVFMAEIVNNNTGIESYDGLAEFFGINHEESYYLFGPHHGRSADHAFHGQRVLDFVSRKRAEAQSTGGR
jgi:hypothetical protein